MRFWPEKRWKKALLVAFMVLFVAGVPIVAYLEYSVYREVTVSIDVKNASGIKTALLVYHPGLSEFSHDIAYGFADGLAQNGWRTETSTASSQTPTDLSHYGLLVLIWPLYDFNPGPTVTNYIHRIDNLKGINTIIVAIGGGIDPLNAVGSMRNIVQAANGTIQDSLTIYRGGGGYTDKALNAAKAIMP